MDLELAQLHQSDTRLKTPRTNQQLADRLADHGLQTKQETRIA